MTIAQIKSLIGQPVLSMVQQTKEIEGVKVPQPWVSHWDNTNRVRVTMHKEVFDKIAADPLNFSGLAVKPAEVCKPEDTTKEPYTLYMVITPTNILATF